ncbi:MAG: ATPase [Firmicutes bacterium]|nr:ATPase [Bacillota bacterium]
MFKKAERRKIKLRLALCGPSGSGKTYSALKIANGIGGKIALLDTENGSGSLYSHLCDYDTAEIAPPFTVEKYIATIKEAEAAGYDVLIIDSLTHAWAGQGGLLEEVDKRQTGKANSFAAWRDVTPMHNRLVDTILQSKMHIIVTMRSKTAYEIETDERGKKVPIKKGMAPIQRDGLEYEFTVVLDLDNKKHVAEAGKDRTGLFDSKVFVPDESTGQQIMEWLESGAEPPKPRITDIQRRKVFAMSKEAGIKPDEMKDHIHTSYNVESSNDITADQAQELIEWLDKRIVERQEQQEAAQ